MEFVLIGVVLIAIRLIVNIVKIRKRPYLTIMLVDECGVDPSIAEKIQNACDVFRQGEYGDAAIIQCAYTGQVRSGELLHIFENFPGMISNPGSVRRDVHRHGLSFDDLLKIIGVM